MQGHQERAKHLHKEAKTGNLQKGDWPHEDLPAKTQADNPDTEGSARVSQAACSCANMPGYAEPEEVEQ